MDYPVLQKCLLMPPSLESRCITFWVKENMKEEFEREFNKEFKEEFMLMSKEEFLSKNIETLYEENEGNHFKDGVLRMAKGIKWILE